LLSDKDERSEAQALKITKIVREMIGARVVAVGRVVHFQLD